MATKPDHPLKTADPERYADLLAAAAHAREARSRQTLLKRRVAAISLLNDTRPALTQAELDAEPRLRF